MNKGIKLYGLHAGICAVAIVIAFAVNTRINIAQAHTYAVSEPVPTLLKEITSVEEENGTISFSGWGFDFNCYNEESLCELILQDTETKEALWPNMKKSLEPVAIEERYTDGEDYSDVGFEGSIKTDKLGQGSVYEILIRYTSDYIDQDGKKQPYIRTVTTDQFFYQGELIDYNPKTFLKPDIAGTELEKELEEAKLFHYFPEGMWVYYDTQSMYYIIEKTMLEGKEGIFFPLHWFVKNSSALPEDRQPYGFGNSDFSMGCSNCTYTEVGGYWIVTTDFASEDVVYISTGICCANSDWFLIKERQLVD